MAGSKDPAYNDEPILERAVLMGRKASTSQDHYVLEKDAPRLEPNLGRWMDWMAANDKERRIEETKITDAITVITEFIGIESFPNPKGGPPNVFQSMVVGGKPNGMMQVYGSVAAAREGHPLLVRMVRKYFTQDEDTNVISGNQP